MLSLLALPFHFSEAHFKVWHGGQVYRTNREPGTGSSIWALRPPCRCVPRLEAGLRHRVMSLQTQRSEPAGAAPPSAPHQSLWRGDSQCQKLTLGRVSVPPFESVHRGRNTEQSAGSLGKDRECVLGTPHGLPWLPCIHTFSLSHTHAFLLYILPAVGKILKIYRKTEKNSTISSDSYIFSVLLRLSDLSLHPSIQTDIQVWFFFCLRDHLKISCRQYPNLPSLS